MDHTTLHRSQPELVYQTSQSTHRKKKMSALLLESEEEFEPENERETRNFQADDGGEEEIGVGEKREKNTWRVKFWLEL